MVDRICIFEGIYYTRLLPLVYFRPVYDLRCGIFTLREKIKHYFPGIPISLHCRSYLLETLRQKNIENEINKISGKNCLFINGRVLVDSDFVKQIDMEKQNILYVNGDSIVAALVSGVKLDSLKHQLNDLFTYSDFNELETKNIHAKLIDYPWDLIANNGQQIISDFQLIKKQFPDNSIAGILYEGAHIINKEQIIMGKGAKIKPGAVIDAENGPVFIDENAVIYPNSTIEGPAYIGANSQIKIGAKIYENTSIGEVCKVGGEVEESIIHSYSNKQHDGFLGHSYLAKWVNLGADTNNSDLKNNYGSVRVVINGEQIDSGSMFVGLTMGDHSKSAINTMFNTGTVVGVSSNIFGGSFPSKYIPSFSWGGSESITSYDLDRSIEVARRVMLRRKITMSAEDEKLFRKIFDLTKEARRKRGMPN